MSDTSVLIVDDEPLARRVVRTLLAAHADLVIVGECGNGREAVEAIRVLEPKLLFLDVQMPDLDGFGVLRAVASHCPPAVVLVTAYDEFAVRAFEAEALDFLVKPFTDDRFHAAVRRARRRLALSEVTDLSRLLTAAAQRVASDDPAAAGPRWRSQLIVTSGVRSIPLSVQSITWIEADDYYARVHIGTQAHLHRRSLTLLEQELDPRVFVRIHRSALVNMHYVQELVRTRTHGLAVVLRDGTRLEVSERRRAAVLRALGGQAAAPAAPARADRGRAS